MCVFLRLYLTTLPHPHPQPLKQLKLYLFFDNFPTGII